MWIGMDSQSQVNVFVVVYILRIKIGYVPTYSLPYYLQEAITIMFVKDRIGVFIK